MSSLSEWFGWNRSTTDDELPNIYPVPIAEGDFISIDITAIYSKILVDVLERTEGLSDDQVALMWDNCLKSEKADGLVTMVAKAMADKKELFLVYEKALKVIREADATEREAIRADYKSGGKSAKGVYVTFGNFRRSDMVKFYLALSYCTVGSLWKSMNLSKAVQIKISDLRKSVSLADVTDVREQAKKIATALGNGKDVMLDEKDEITTAVPELTATKEAVLFVGCKLAFYLGLPDSYLTGEQSQGIGSTGENDMRATERGLKGYYFSIMKPLLEVLLDVKTTYKTQDFSLIESSSDILKTFALIDDTLVSADNKRKIINGLLGLPEDAKGDPAPKPEPKAEPIPAPAAKPGIQPN
jgi:hypothetical protein